MKTFVRISTALPVYMLATQAIASTINGFGVGTSATTGQYLDGYGGVETNVAAYRMGQDSSGNYTNMSDVAPVNFSNCNPVNPNCSASQGGTAVPGFDQTFSTSNAGLIFNGGLAAASTYANLATGSLGASGSTGYYQVSSTTAKFVDTLNFSIAGASAATTTNIIVKFQLDGGLFAPDAPVGTPGLGTRSAGITDSFGFGAANGMVGFDLYGANLSYGGSVQDLQQRNSQSGWDSYTWDSISPGLTQFTGVYSLTGSSQSLGISNSLRGYAQSIGSFAYGNTSSLSFVLPSNVTFSSASGTFLSALASPPPPTAVPEPATWAMMIGGFAALGLSRRQKAAVNFA